SAWDSLRALVHLRTNRRPTTLFLSQKNFSRTNSWLSRHQHRQPDGRWHGQDSGSRKICALAANRWSACRNFKSRLQKPAETYETKLVRAPVLKRSRSSAHCFGWKICAPRFRHRGRRATHARAQFKGCDRARGQEPGKERTLRDRQMEG